MTAEHLFSQWMNKAIGPGPPVTTVFSREPESGEAIRREWIGDLLSQTAKVVCNSCNEGWMSHLEELEAKPIMRDMIVSGSPVSIFPRQVVSIAAFAFKSAVIGDHATHLSKPFFTKDERKRFMVSMTIPSGIQIWLSALPTPSNLRTGFFLGRNPYVEPKAPRGFKLYVVTYGIGHFAFQLVAFKYHRSRFRKHAEPLTLAPSALWSNAATLLWPNDGGTVEWPPREQLDRDLIQAFADRWQLFDVPSGFLDG